MLQSCVERKKNHSEYARNTAVQLTSRWYRAEQRLAAIGAVLEPEADRILEQCEAHQATANRNYLPFSPLESPSGLNCLL